MDSSEVRSWWHFSKQGPGCLESSIFVRFFQRTGSWDKIELEPGSGAGSPSALRCGQGVDIIHTDYRCGQGVDSLQQILPTHEFVTIMVRKTTARARIPISWQHTTGTGMVASWTSFNTFLSTFYDSGRSSRFSHQKNHGITICTVSKQGFGVDNSVDMV